LHGESLETWRWFRFDLVKQGPFENFQPMHFEFATAARIIFGAATVREAAALANEFGTRALLVTGRNMQRAEPLTRALDEGRVSRIVFPVAGEPSVATIEEAVGLAREHQCQLVIAVGGGSVLDAGKAVAAMLTNEGALMDYLEVIGRGKVLSRPSAPLIAIPTTAGTGSEVTRNAVLASPGHRVKVSLRSPFMLPKIALIDPELTHDLPPALTASTGLDALTQLIEPYVCARANPLTDALCAEGIQRAARSLRAAYQDGHNAGARADMAVAGLFGGMALTHAGLGAVHGFAAPIGGMFPAPHGAICAALLPHVMAANLAALKERMPDSEALSRYDLIAQWLTGNAAARADDGVAWIAELVHEFKIPRLSSYGIQPDHLPELMGKATRASSMKANPVALSSAELRQILERASG
jgi:alcohol dehydrogenase class IV